MFQLVFQKKEDLPTIERALYAEIDNIRDKESLFGQIAKKLQFPLTFNHTWGSLSECMNNLNWLEGRTVFICHGNHFALTDSDFKAYVNILISSIYSWIYSMTRKDFRVVFSPEDKERVLDVIQFSFHTKDDISGIKDALFVNISDVPDKDSLFNQMEEMFRFPPYFGHNWDALYECITDLEWIEEKNVIINHEHLVHMPDDTLNIYVSLLIDAMYSWIYWPSRKGFEQIGFYVVFSPLDRDRIRIAIRRHFSN